MMDAKFDGADFSGAGLVRICPGRASSMALRWRQSFQAWPHAGLSRSIHGGQARRTSFKGASLARAVFEFASLRDVDFSGADLSGCSLAGADLTGANVAGANFNDADVNSAKLLSLRGRESAIDFEKARNLEHAFRD